MRAGAGRATRRNERGQALAEFALVLPLILLFIAGIVEMGRAWNIKQAVTDAAREGARYAVVQDNTINTIDDVKAKVEERLALASIETSTIDVAGDFQTAGEVTVTVSTQHQMGLIGALLQWAGGPAVVTISTQATMRSEWGATP
jgi:Flp pilus assembly protein TadG